MMSRCGGTPVKGAGGAGCGMGFIAAWRRILPGCILCSLLAFLAGVPAAGASDPISSAFTLRMENDVIQHTDENYTSGISLGYTRNDTGFLGGIWNTFGLDRGRLYSSYELAQLIFTPSDLVRNPPDSHDRPYAGLLYIGMTTGLQTDTSLQVLKLLIGVVGPSSLGEAGQKAIHQVLRQKLPSGWGHQLKDEIVLNLLYEYRRRYRLFGGYDGFGAELIPIGTAMLGNYQSKARVEGELRFGYQLPDDFGDTSIRGLGTAPLPGNGSGHDSGIYLFAGGGGELIGRDITLDGNSFRSGPGVDKKNFVSTGVVGLALRYGSFLGSFSYILRGQEFDGQKEGEKYGSVSLTYLLR